MGLSLLKDYESPTISGFLTLADEIYVDDLRADNDRSLEAVPRINDFVTLKSIFKLDVLTTLGGDLVQPDEKYFKLVGFYLRTGVAAFIPKVLDENGNPLRDILIYAHWPGAPELGHIPNPNYFTDGRGIADFTNENGDRGFGYSGEGAFGPDGGAFAIWPSADPPNFPRQHSDCAVKLGWHGATDHLTPNPVFQVVTKSGDSGDPLPPGEGNQHVLTQHMDGVEISRTIITVQTSLRVE